MTFIYRGAQKYFESNFLPVYKIQNLRLQIISKIGSFSVSGGTAKIKIDENSKALAITHLDDLAINLSGVDLSPSTKAS